MTDLAHLRWSLSSTGLHLWAADGEGQEYWLPVSALLPALAPLLARETDCREREGSDGG